MAGLSLFEKLWRQHLVADPHAADAKGAVEHAHIHWAYEGEGAPDNWAKLDPKNKLCASGQRQSPIDIRDTLKVDQEPLQFDYKPTLFSVLDTGRTLLISPDAGSGLRVGQRRYELQAIEARMPAEIRVNGERYDMALHLLHRDADGRLAMLVLLMQRGDAEQAVLQRFWAHVPLEKQLSERATTAVDLAQLLRHHFQAAYGVSPTAWRQSFRGA